MPGCPDALGPLSLHRQAHKEPSEAPANGKPRLFVCIVSKGIASAGVQAHVSLDVDAAPHRPVVLRAAWRQAIIPILVTSDLKQFDKLIGPTPAPAADGPGIASDMYDLMGIIKANQWHRVAGARAQAGPGHGQVDHRGPARHCRGYRRRAQAV